MKIFSNLNRFVWKQILGNMRKSSMRSGNVRSLIGTTNGSVMKMKTVLPLKWIILKTKGLGAE